MRSVNAVSDAESAVSFYFHFLVNRLRLRGSPHNSCQSSHVACVISIGLPSWFKTNIYNVAT